MSLPPDVRESYVKIIDSILAASDLSSVSAKQIRKGIQSSVDYDVTPQKEAIKELTMERFDIMNAKRSAETNHAISANGSEPPTNGHVSDEPVRSVEKPSTPPSSASPASPTKKRASDSETIQPDGVTSPAKKKRKAEPNADAVLAAKLQAEENLRARPTRGGNTRKAAPVKKKMKTPTKVKTSKKIKAEDDSEIEDSASEEKKVNRNTGFHKPMVLSAPLSELLGGETTLSRPQTTKKIWEYIHAHELQDPTDKRHIICDEKMRAVLKTDRVHMFTMTKILNQNLYNPDE